MSIIKQYLPVCDYCGESNPDMMIDKDSVKGLKRRMIDDGWICISGKDVCPDCIRTPKDKV